MACRAAVLLSAVCLALLAAAPERALAQEEKQASHAWTAAAAQDHAAALEPTAEGAVARLLINPYGEVDGLWLEDGTIVRCSPRMGEQLAASVQPGDEVSVTGDLHAPGTVRALTVRNDTRGGTVAEPPPAVEERPPFAPPARAVPLEPLQAQGSIEAVLHGRRSEANGVILHDGSIVRFPPYTMPFLVREGEPFAAVGRGTRNRYGLSIDATSVGRSLGLLQPLYAGVR